MASLTDEEFSSAATSLESVRPNRPRSINSNIKISGAYRNLLKAAPVKLVSISKEEKAFHVASPAYIHRFSVFGPDLTALKNNLAVEAVLLDGSKLPLTPKSRSVVAPSGGAEECVEYSVKKICTSLVVRSVRPFLRLKAARVDVVGYTFEQGQVLAKKIEKTLEISDQLSEYVSSKQEIVRELTDRRSELTAEVEDIEAELEDLQKQSSEQSEALESVKSQVTLAQDEKARLSEALASANSSLEAAKNNETQLSATVKSLNKEISAQRAELARLENDRSLISDEFVDYVKEGKRQTFWYILILACVMGVLLFGVLQLYWGAERILRSDVVNFESLAVLSLQRFPFALALALVITVCWRLSSALIKRIIDIHSQRLVLARLLVIAKDTVYSSTSGLEVSDSIRFSERIKLKMAMLKAHLVSELGPNFTYPERDPEDAGRDEIGATHNPDVEADENVEAER